MASYNREEPPRSREKPAVDWERRNRKRLDDAFRPFVQQILGYRPREKALITSEGPGTLSFAFARSFFTIMSEISPHASWIATPYRDPGAPMEKAVLQAMHSGIDLLVQTNATGIGNALPLRNKPYRLNGRVFTNPVYYLKAVRKIRAFWFMVNSPEHFLRCLRVDYKTLGTRSAEIASRMRRANRVHITSPNGTDLFLDLDRNRKPNCDYDATQHRKGQGGNLPMGEVFVSPSIDSAEGTYVIDGSFNTQFPWTTVMVRNPVSLVFRKGQLVSVEGGREAEVFLRNVKEAEQRTKRMIRQGKITPALGARYAFATRAVGEFAIGLNEKAEIIGDLLIDEKRHGDAHIALGRSYDGDPSLIHMDAIVRKPKVVFQYRGGCQETILENGKVRFPEL